MARGMAVAVVALLVGGCAIFRVPETPVLGGVPIREAMARARDGNWRVRASTAQGSADARAGAGSGSPGAEAPVQAEAQAGAAGGARVEGRVSFVTDSTAQVGGKSVRLREVERLERWSYRDLGGRPAGFVAGAALGTLLGAFLHSFWEFGYERPCAGLCTLRIYLPAIGITGLAGTAIGSAVKPPAGEWVDVWRR